MADMVEIGRRFKEVDRLPVIIQSNAGLPRQAGDKLLYGESPEFMADTAGGLIEANVKILGGCCGTTPAHIRLLRNRLDSA
jgi:methionine synthase I (cobalamin-dependent)